MQHLNKKKRILHWSYANVQDFVCLFLSLGLPAFMLRMEKKKKTKGFSVFRATQNFVCDTYTKIQPEVSTGLLHLHPVKNTRQNIIEESKLSGTALKATTWSLPPSMSHSKPSDTVITCYLPEKCPQYLSVTTKLNLWCGIHHTWQTHILVWYDALKQDKVHLPGKFQKEKRKRRCLPPRHRFPSIRQISIENSVFQIGDLEKYKPLCKVS